MLTWFLTIFCDTVLLASLLEFGIITLLKAQVASNAAFQLYWKLKRINCNTLRSQISHWETGRNCVYPQLQACISEPPWLKLGTLFFGLKVIFDCSEHSQDWGQRSRYWPTMTIAFFFRWYLACKVLTSQGNNDDAVSVYLPVYVRLQPWWFMRCSQIQ